MLTQSWKFRSSSWFESKARQNMVPIWSSDSKEILWLDRLFNDLCYLLVCTILKMEHTQIFGILGLVISLFWTPKARPNFGWCRFCDYCFTLSCCDLCCLLLNKQTLSLDQISVMCQFIGSDFGHVAPKPFFGNATPTYHYQTNKPYSCSLVVHIQRFLLVVLNFV